ncbi:anti-sigma factor antagonist [Saccharopolyspora elongata]|uniref:Anti-sigma factor antagonist n=2 Tax=Saccharopolyspora elongata TaxID=2530387 RepID=A0A4V6PDM1_9PSEU|nr:anti-sigma factor antagonist [Saccharopolyspora elongata]
MTTIFPIPEQAPAAVLGDTAVPARTEPTTRFWVRRPSRHIVVVGATGDLDTATTPRFAELLTPRLASVVDAVVIDLSRLNFLGADALRVLMQAQQRAQARGFGFRLITGPPCVASALRAAGMLDRFDAYPAQAAAVAA